MRSRIFILSLMLTTLLSACGAPANTDHSETKDSQETRIVSPEFTLGEDTPLVGIDEAMLPLPEPVETARISFLAAGDNVIHPCIYMDAEKRADETTRKYNFKPMYADVADYIASFDLAFINQETLMGGEELGYSGYPNFNSPQDLGLDLIDIGFDIINIANNHMCDKGSAGLAGTINFWKSQESITMIGGYSDKTDYDTLRIIEREGIKIALLSYTYGTNGLRLPASSEMVVPYINDDNIIRQCKAAREAADFVIISVHWGEENISQVTDEQKRVAQLMADNGADVIIGHHPHVLQSIEWIESSNGETLCIYSLGNLVSAMQYWQNMVGGFFTFDIVVMSDGEVYADSPAFVPTAFYYGPSYYNSHLYFLSEYPDEMAKTHGTKNLYKSAATPADMKRYAEKIMGEYVTYDISK
ncbi:MAG: CapA family protein [Clostridiales bacterium]|nr:CapA family protein [Clostridiales bacterium]